MAAYTESGHQGSPPFDTAQAVAVMLEKHGDARDLMHGFIWDKWTSGAPTERLQLFTRVNEIATIAWTFRESALARIRVLVKPIPNRHGYPPVLKAEPVKMPLAQAEVLSAAWV